MVEPAVILWKSGARGKTIAAGIDDFALLQARDDIG
jgi:hypothetical protein